MLIQTRQAHDTTTTTNRHSLKPASPRTRTPAMAAVAVCKPATRPNATGRIPELPSEHLPDASTLARPEDPPSATLPCLETIQPLRAGWTTPLCRHCLPTPTVDFVPCICHGRICNWHWQKDRRLPLFWVEIGNDQTWLRSLPENNKKSTPRLRTDKTACAPTCRSTTRSCFADKRHEQSRIFSTESTCSH